MRDFQRPGRSAVFATNGMCATSHPLAAGAAVDVLKQGGNAMDAALAGAVLLGLAEPQMTGIGGDLFALISPAGGDDIIAINGSGRAPGRIDAAKLRDQGLTTAPLGSPHAVTIPGAVDAICALSERFGKLGLADSLAPAIGYMDAGIPIAPRVAFDWTSSADRLQGHARKHFLVNGSAPSAGQRFALPGQAEVLRRIAKDGRAGFYSGEVLDDMLAALTNLGGAHRAEDFAATACTFGDPISGMYKSQEIVEHPPNGQGGVAILILNILSHFDLSALDPFGAERAHIEIEAAKLAYGARNRLLADLDHMAQQDVLLDPDLARQLATQIDPKRAAPGPAGPREAVHKDTIYITVVDRDRMAVSLIYSLFHSFGSGIASEKFGILFQNRGAGFSLEAGHPNEMGPGKRPMHTIIPGILRDQGRVRMPFGVMGGQYQPCGHARLITNLLDYGMELQSALDAPRSFFEDGKLMLERGYGDDVRSALADMGHPVDTPEGPIGGAQAIDIRPDGVLVGASDPRKDGCAFGF